MAGFIIFLVSMLWLGCGDEAKDSGAVSSLLPPSNVIEVRDGDYNIGQPPLVPGTADAGAPNTSTPGAPGAPQIVALTGPTSVTNGGTAVLHVEVAPPQPVPIEPAPASGALLDLPHVRVDLEPAGTCTAAASCEARMRVTALGGYKVNAEYPHKFVGEVSPDLAIDGTGTFTVDDAGRGTMTIRFRPAKAGTLTMIGTLKLSVCSEEECKIETPRLSFAVAAL